MQQNNSNKTMIYLIKFITFILLISAIGGLSDNGVIYLTVGILTFLFIIGKGWLDLIEFSELETAYSPYWANRKEKLESSRNIQYNQRWDEYYPKASSRFEISNEENNKRLIEQCKIKPNKIEVIEVERPIAQLSEPKQTITEIPNIFENNITTIDEIPIEVFDGEEDYIVQSLFKDSEPPKNNNITQIDNGEGELIMILNTSKLSSFVRGVYYSVLDILKGLNYSPSKLRAMIARVQYIDVIDTSHFIIYEKIPKSEAHIRAPHDEIILGLQEKYANNQLQIEFKEILTPTLLEIHEHYNSN